MSNQINVSDLHRRLQAQGGPWSKKKQQDPNSPHGKIWARSDSGGYVYFHCRHYRLPDNTQGQIGYHVFYRPLSPGYTGNEGFTEEMARDLRNYYGLTTPATTEAVA